MGKIKCECGNTFFTKVMINEFHDHATNLYTSLNEVDVDHDIKLYQCLCCKKYMLPPIDYFSSSEEDKELYAILESALEGKVLKRKEKLKSKRIQPGTAAFLSKENEAKPGTFTQVN